AHGVDSPREAFRRRGELDGRRGRGHRDPVSAAHIVEPLDDAPRIPLFRADDPDAAVAADADLIGEVVFRATFQHAVPGATNPDAARFVYGPNPAVGAAGDAPQARGDFQTVPAGGLLV